MRGQTWCEIKTCILLNYRHKDFGYRLYDSIEKKVIRSRDVVYLEDQTIESIDKDDKSRFSDDILASSDSNPIRVPVDFDHGRVEIE